MKSLLLFIFAVAVVAVADSQVAIQNDRVNVLLLGQPNPVTIAVGGYKSADLIVQTNNGKIVAGSSPGEYIVSPATPGDVSIDVYVKTAKGPRLAGTRHFSVQVMPLTAVRIDANNYPSPALPLVSVSPSAFFGLDINSKWTITRLECSIFREGDEIFSKTYSNRAGIQPDEETRKFMLTLKEGDIIMLDNIMARDPKDGTIRNLSPLKYKIARTGGL